LRQALLRAQAAAPRDVEKLYYPVEIRLVRRTGGVNTDGKPGDDAVNVYIQPIDRNGDIVKAAGEIDVQLYDLAEPDDRQLVGEMHVPLDEAGKAWYGQLMTQHFTVVCPWKNGPPKHGTITVRASFTDYLTGAALHAQTTCEVALPG
jgi:hypothetical protein